MMAHRPIIDATATVIVYHAVGERPRELDPEGLFISRRRFERQMEFLARRRLVVPLSQIVAPGRDVRRPRVAITFDDGFRNVLTEAVPVLRRHALPAALFVPTRWLEEPRDNASVDGVETLAAAELRELDRLGYEVGSHSHSHLDCSRAAGDQIRADLAQSVTELTAVLGRAPRYLAWPFGRYSEAALEAAAQVGFELAFATDQPSRSPYAVPRVPIYATDGATMFRFKTTGWYTPWRRSRPVTMAYPLLRPLWKLREGLRP
jgi:peptidoglycan/xylan/chitin deacetylase (PgdA/CDA1 family)